MGRDKRNENASEHWTKMLRSTMQSEAWRSLSTAAQALYPWLKLEWKGPNANNNGRIRLSVRQASGRLGVGTDTVSRAFHDLQAKGFIVVTEPARLGMSGEAKSPAYEITELGMPHAKGQPRALFKEWQRGRDFSVHKTMANNPRGSNGRKKPCHENLDEGVIKIGTVVKMPSRKS